MSTSGVQIKMAAPVTASVSDPQLDVKTVTVVSSQELRLRVACHNPAECLPFFAVAAYSEPVSSREVQVKLEHHASDTVGGRAASTAVGGKPVVTPEVGAAHQDNLQEPQRLRAGSAAMLNLDGGRVHILVKVICLEGGAIGDKIRVSSRDRKQSYMAKIVSPELLKGDI